jgi:hypothetical protein
MATTILRRFVSAAKNILRTGFQSPAGALSMHGILGTAAEAALDGSDCTFSTPLPRESLMWRVSRLTFAKTADFA